MPSWRASSPTRLRFVICAAARPASDGAVEANPFFSTQKEKYGTPLWVFRISQTFCRLLYTAFLNLTPLWRKGATAPLVRSTTLVFNEPPRSNFACLAGEPALRLACASLSAPPLALRATVRWRQILSSPRKKKNTEHPYGYSVFLAEKKGFEPSRRLPDLHP